MVLVCRFPYTSLINFQISLSVCSPENVIKLEPEIKTASEKISRNGESYSIIETQRKFESETTERENVVKLEPEIKTEEDIKIKLEPNDEKDSQNELRELISEKEAVDPAPVINNEKVKVQFTFNFGLD